MVEFSESPNAALSHRVRVGFLASGPEELLEPGSVFELMEGDRSVAKGTVTLGRIMMIAPHETVMTGTWVVSHGHVTGDETCERIVTLSRNYLVKVGHDPSGWDVLYRDPTDRRLWELIYPQSQMQGGGPPELRCLSLADASRKYGKVLDIGEPCAPGASTANVD